MGTSRYFRSNVVNRNTFVNRSLSYKIHNAVHQNLLETNQYVLTAGERLDIIAGKYYDDANYWWVIAAASGIGWNLQVPPGTLLRIPTDISKVLSLL